MSDRVVRSRRIGTRWLQVLIVAAVLMLPVAIGLRLLTTGLGVDTDIQSILPSPAVGQGAIAAIRQAGTAASSRFALGIRGGTPALRRTAAESLEAGLRATGLFVPGATDMAETATWIRANRYEIACAPGVDALDDNWGRRLARRARVLLFSGMVPLSGIDLAEDPFLLQLEHLECLMPDTGTAAGDGAMVVVAGRLTASPYQLDVQARLRAAIETWHQDARFADLDMPRTGAVFFAEAAGAGARQEINQVGGASMLLILLLYFLAFRNLKAAGLALATVVAGGIGGSGLCFAVFGQVHFSVFVFGSALTGISADYAVHSLAARRADRISDSGAAHDSATGLRRALTVSMLTSVAGFAALLLFDIAVFRQIGVFAIGGLFFAWLFAIVLLPRLDRLDGATAPGRPGLLRCARNATRQTGRWRAIGAAVGLVCVIAIAGLSTVTFSDDIRRFQPPPPDLVADRDILYPEARGQMGTGFLLSSGNDRQAALRQEEGFFAAPGASATDFIALSRFDPSAARRASVREAYAAYLLGPHLSSLQAELGTGVTADGDMPPPNGTAARPAWLAALQFEHVGRVYLLAPMLANSTVSGAGETDSTRLIDPVVTYGAALRDYRTIALRILATSAIFAAIFMLLVYRRARALMLVLPSILGGVLALSLPSLLGIPVTLFSVLALFIVLGTGIDFSVFRWEMRQDRTGWTPLAVLIAALSTCAAMGMLGFSNTLPVQSFGVTIAIGVLASMVCSFLLPISSRGAIVTNAQ